MGIGYIGYAILPEKLILAFGTLVSAKFHDLIALSPIE